MDHFSECLKLSESPADTPIVGMVLRAAAREILFQVREPLIDLVL